MDAWPPTPQPGAEDCLGCGGIGIVAVNDLCDESWLTRDTPGDQWRPCLECQDPSE